MRKALYILIGSLVLLCSCSVDTECRQDMTVAMGLSFVGDSLRMAADSSGYEHVQFTSSRGLQVWGLGSDSLLADSANTVSTVYVPLRKDTNECAYAVAYQGYTDTLRCYYERKEKFVSLACGCAVFATLDTIEIGGGHFIDSIKFTNNAVSTIKEKHVTVYYHKQ